MNADLAANGGGDDRPPTTSSSTPPNGDDVVERHRRGPDDRVAGLPAQVSVSGADPGNDRLTVNALAGDDVVDASELHAGAVLLTLNGGDGDDVLIGGDGNDTLTRRRR